MSSQQAKDLSTTFRLFKPRSFIEFLIILVLYLLAGLYLPLALGICLGYIIGYYHLHDAQKTHPKLWPLPQGIGKHVLLGAGIIPLTQWGVSQYLLDPTFRPPSGIYLLADLLVVGSFLYWRGKIWVGIEEAHRYGSARKSTKRELKSHRKADSGLYIGGGTHKYPKSGHLISIAGTRGGKMVNLLAPNLLGADSFSGSKVVFDPKGELAAITSDYQASLGKTVCLLNPWNVLGLGSGMYNPMDLVSDPDDPELVPDDCQLLAEMIVPYNPDKENHWAEKSRSLISSIILYLTTRPPQERNLIELWRLLRLDEPETLFEKMAMVENSLIGEIIHAAASEMVALMSSSPKEFAGVLSTAQKHTDIFKSPQLRRNLCNSSFDISSLTDGNTILYVIIPADKLQSHYRWLRLVISTVLKAVIRKPNQPVAFMIDEAASLGYMPDLQTGMALYAGYNVTLWTIWQSLSQLKQIYKESFETFISNAATRHFFALNDNTTAEYVSKLAGQTSSFGGKGKQENTSARPLFSPDEVRRSNEIFTFIDNNPVALFKKVPYFSHKTLNKRAAPNPYFRG